MAKAQNKKSKGLGRGLSALIPDSDMDFLSRVARGDASATLIVKGNRADSAATNAEETAIIDNEAEQLAPDDEAGSHQSTPDGTMSGRSAGASENATQWVNVAVIEANPYQPRRTFSPQEMEELAASVREHGIIQPILLRPLTDASESESGYQLVAGERRWRAAQAAGLEQVPAIVRALSDQQALELALIENVQRHDISPLDAALAYRRLIHEFSLSQEAVAQRVGKSRVAVANTLRLLDLPTEAQKAIEEGVLSEGHGRAILLAGSDGARRAVFRQVLREKLSVRATEELARRSMESDSHEGSNGKSTSSKRKTTGQSVELRSVEENLQKTLQTRVRLKPRAKGGQIVIEYFSGDDLERLITKLITS